MTPRKCTSRKFKMVMDLPDIEKHTVAQWREEKTALAYVAADNSSCLLTALQTLIQLAWLIEGDISISCIQSRNFANRGAVLLFSNF